MGTAIWFMRNANQIPNSFFCWLFKVTKLVFTWAIEFPNYLEQWCSICQAVLKSSKWLYNWFQFILIGQNFYIFRRFLYNCFSKMFLFQHCGIHPYIFFQIHGKQMYYSNNQLYTLISLKGNHKYKILDSLPKTFSYYIR